MNSSLNKPVLPKNPTLKDINKYKKQMNWGELPSFYHMMSSSVSELESLQTMGFDNALNRICKKTNWNLDLLGGYIDDHNIIHVEKKPRLALYQVITDRGFEIHCFPYAKTKEIDQYVKGHRLMEFETWDPGTMKMLCRVNQMHKFIDFYFERGDAADRALILYAIKSVEKLIDYMREHVEVVKVDGVSIKQYFESQEKKLDDCELDSLLLGGLKGNDLSNGGS
ncbi:hypothetical protein [Catenovulum maritimum]|uniref:Uncharacterized protein n=1 Tax=Catenovulum maritimum TaxID=1513271 RepID=A0A0J8GUV2_9ALTE|nr:hypothetical protein [Catenovulum maritimum]KMT66550.1 hypothetical protein XM47_03170 [Catenovulum maritimum]